MSLLPLAGQGTVKIWDGSYQGGNWGAWQNWSDNSVPVDGDDLIFPATAVGHFSNTNDIVGLEVHSITFLAGGYTLNGNSVTITTSDGINGDHSTGTCVVNLRLALQTDAEASCVNAGSTLRLDGSIHLDGHNLTCNAIHAASDIQIGGAVSGAGNVIKEGPGHTLFDGLLSNTYTGTTKINAGTLELNDIAAAPVTMIPGDVIISNENNLTTATLLLTEGNQIADTATVNVFGYSQFTLSNVSETIADLWLQFGDVSTGTGTLTLGSNATLVARGNDMVSSLTPTISGNLNVGTGTCTVYAEYGRLSIPAVVSGTADIVKSGSGNITLSSPNTFTGALTLKKGFTTISDSSALGTSDGGTIIEAPAYLDLVNNVHVVGEDLTLNNPYTGLRSFSGTNTWSATVTLLQDTEISTRDGSRLTIDGPIGGTGALTKTGHGTLTLSGTTANTYNGATVAEDGVLELNKAIFDGAIPGDLYAGVLGVSNSASIVYLQHNQIPNSHAVTLYDGSLMDLDSHWEGIGSLTLYGARVKAPGAGFLAMYSPATITAAAASSAMPEIEGRLRLSTPECSITTDHGLTISAEIFELGSAGITKKGSNNLYLHGTNTYSGTTIVEDGRVWIYNASALGSPSGGTVVSNGATLVVDGSYTVAGESLTLNGADGAAAGWGSLDLTASGDVTWAGPVILNADSTINPWNPASILRISGPISGTGGFIVGALNGSGTGELYLEGSDANIFGGTVSVNSGCDLILSKTVTAGAIPGNLEIYGTVVLSGNQQTAPSCDVWIDGTGVFDCANRWTRIDELSGTGGITYGTGGYLAIGYDNGSSIFDGNMTGSGYPGGWALGKYGAGTITLNGTNNYTEGTRIFDGTLVVNGNHLSNSWMNVYYDTATLAGNGFVCDVTCNGNLKPGTSPGILTCSNLTFSASGDYYVELAGPEPGTGYDQMVVHGTNALAGSTLHVIPAFITPVKPGDQFVIIKNDGPAIVSGIFNGLPNNAEFSSGDFTFRINYDSDVVLTLVDMPIAQAAEWITGGNGNNVIDRSECNELMLAISNDSGTPMTGISAHLASVTRSVMVTQPESAYPDVAVGGMELNITPFQLSTLSGFIPGSVIDLDLVVQTSTHGTFIVPIALSTPTTPSSSPVRFDISTPLAIPDVGTVESTNSVEFIGPLTKLRVSLWLTHPYAGDLTLELVSPEGTSIMLSDMNGGTGADYGTGSSDADRVVFDDDAGTAITEGSAPFVGTYQPEEGLYNLLNDWPYGNWCLRVTDSFGGSLGTLRAWSLFLYPAVDTPGGGYCDSCMGEINGQITINDTVQTGRLHRHGDTPASCSRPLESEWLFDSEPRYCDVYSFTNTSPDEVCISAGIENTTNQMMMTSYLYSFDPGNILSNYAGYARHSTNPLDPYRRTSVSHSFMVPAGAEFFITVNEVSTNLEGGTYTLLVSGLPCPEPVLKIEAVPADVVRVDWPSWAGGYRLQQSPTLDLPAWSWSSEEPLFDAGRFVVTNAPTTTNRFFRLKKN